MKSHSNCNGMNAEDQYLKRVATAHHEAGHAIVAAMHGIEVLWVDTVKRDGFLGGCELDPESYFLRHVPVGDNFEPLRIGTFGMLSCLLAGRLSEYKIYEENGLYVDITSSSRHDMEIFEGIRCKPIKTAGDQFTHEEIDANVIEVISHGRIWEVIHSLAERLLENERVEGEALAPYVAAVCEVVESGEVSRTTVHRRHGES